MTDYIKRRKAQEEVKEAIRIVAVHPNGKLPSQEATDIFLKCMSAIKDIPSAYVVSREAYDQIRCERDTAIAQLEKLGYGLGEEVRQ